MDLIFGIVGDIAEAMPVKVDVFELSEVKKLSALFDNILKEGTVIYER